LSLFARLRVLLFAEKPGHRPDGIPLFDRGTVRLWLRYIVKVVPLGRGVLSKISVPRSRRRVGAADPFVRRRHNQAPTPAPIKPATQP
jgi:hypothetical protein